jgi:hypothetical protein
MLFYLLNDLPILTKRIKRQLNRIYNKVFYTLGVTMKKTYLLFLIPTLLMMIFMGTQLMSPFGTREVISVILVSTISGSLIGFALYLINRFLKKNNEKKA